MGEFTRRNFGFSVAGGLVAVAGLPVMAGPAAAQDLLSQTLGQYGVTKQGLVIDSFLGPDEAIGSSSNPTVQRYLDAMKPYLVVLPVVYLGYDEKTHLGQLVVNKALAAETAKIFLTMFKLKFPIKSVIPQSQFNYDDGLSDDRSMAVNNTSCYRPDDLKADNVSEHTKGAAFDINPFNNPMDTTKDLTIPVEKRVFVPPGGSYDLKAKGTIVRHGQVQSSWRAAGYEWGGNWGYKPDEAHGQFFRDGYYDYQHFQLNCARTGAVYQNNSLLPLPPGSTRNNCTD